MKNLFKFFLTSLILFSVSCSKDDDNGGASAEVAASLKSGTWRITSYSDNGTDKTNDFSSFIFTFYESGAVSASNSILTGNGIWEAGIYNNTHKLLILFNNPGPFNDLSKTDAWEIVSHTSTLVSLRHINSSSGETDLLVFQKN